MNRRLVLLLVICAFALSVAAQKTKQKEASPAFNSLVESEHAFARAAAEKGTRDAFLEFLADDGIVFQPGPVNGKQSWSARPKRPGLLSWYPIFANVSSAGDMGYTTGPWEFRRDGADEKPIAYGNFVSVWKKQADGRWRVALDIGTGNDAPASAPPDKAEGSQQAAIGKPRLKAESVDERTALMNLDREFAKASAADGAAKAFASYAADDVRLHREGQFPVKGKEAALAVLSARAERLSWQPVRADVSRSGDLGYTYGTYELGGADSSPQETGNYLRIWKQEAGGKWKVALDLLNPIPPKQ